MKKESPQLVVEIYSPNMNEWSYRLCWYEDNRCIDASLWVGPYISQQMAINAAKSSNEIFNVKNI